MMLREAIEQYVLWRQAHGAKFATGQNVLRQFLGHARGSILGLETELEIAYDLGYLLEPSYRILESQSFQVLGLLNRLIESLSADRQTMRL